MKAKIYYHDIGDYLSREEKLKKISQHKSFAHLPLTEIIPNEQGDWISMRNTAFESFVALGDKDDKTANTFFVPFYSNGLKTQRDAWCYNSSKEMLVGNISKSIDFYNEQLDLFNERKKVENGINPKDCVSFDATRFSWSDNPISWLSSNKRMIFEQESILHSVYRPFFKQYCYYNRALIERVYQMPKIFPKAGFENRVICVSGAGVTKDFTALFCNQIPDLEIVGKSQCFPLYYYEETPTTQKGLFDEDSKELYTRKDAISDFILERARKQYGLQGTREQGLGNRNPGSQSSFTIPHSPVPDPQLTKEDIFYYVYGFLHSKEYRATFANDLKKMLPRLPLVEEVKDFWAFSKAGRQLADLHLHYETVPPPQA